MLHRIAATIAATAAAVLLASSPAWADDLEDVPTIGDSVVTVEPATDVPACIGDLYEIEPGVWDCYLEPIPFADPDEATGTIGDGYDGEQPTAEPEPVWTDEAPPVDEEPADVVEGDGDWGWSDARDLYDSR